MKKVLKIILLIILVIAAVIGILKLARNIKAKHHAPLVSYRTSYGGGMDGSSSMTKIKKLDDENAMVTLYKSDWIFQDAKVSEYIVPISYLRDVEKLFDKNRIYTFGTLPESRIHVLDAGSDHYSFSFEGYDSVSFDSNQIIPKRGYEALRAIDDVIADAVANGQRLPGLVPLAIEDDEVIFHVTGNDGMITIRVFEYCEDQLQYRIHNGTEEDIELQGNVEIYKIDGDSRRLIAEDSDYDGYFGVYKTHFRDETISLTERLEEGTYLICLDNIQSEFIIGDVTKPIDRKAYADYTEELEGLFRIRTYTDDEGRKIAESFGYEIDDYYRDIDGDGYKEIICNCVFGGDGHEEVYVFKTIDGVPMRGTLKWDEDLLPGLNYWGVNAVQTHYSPSEKDFVIEYSTDNNDIETYRTYSIRSFEFSPFE